VFTLGNWGESFSQSEFESLNKSLFEQEQTGRERRKGERREGAERKEGKERGRKKKGGKEGGRKEIVNASRQKEKHR
jgi:hypothetical protein